MKRSIGSISLLLTLAMVACSKSDDHQSGTDDNPLSPATPKAPGGWVYYGGDEFNGEAIDSKKWFIYGTNGKNDAYGRPQGMIHTYRPEMVALAKSSDGAQVLRITSEKRTDGNQIHGHTAWWSGAISSREVNMYYPLYCRIDIRAKVANDLGTWHALWSRHYKGASTAELDLAEFFSRVNGMDKVSQSLHLHNNKTNKLDINVSATGRQDRRTTIEGISTRWHIYSVSVEPTEKATEAVITFLVDDKKVYSYRTDSREANLHNKFITDATSDKRTDRVWDVIINGGIGGKNEGILYPDAQLKKVVTEVDYVRVFVPKKK